MKLGGVYGFNRWLKDDGGFGGIIGDGDACIKDGVFKAAVKVEEASKAMNSRIVAIGRWKLEGGMVGIR